MGLGDWTDYRTELRERFGVPAAAVYVNDYTRPVVVQGAIPDVDGTPIGVQWERGRIRMGEGAADAARLQRVRALVGWVLGASPIDGPAIRRAYGRRRFFAVDWGPAPALVRVDPAPAGALLPDGPMRVVRGPLDLAAGMPRACSAESAAVGAAAVVRLSGCGPGDLEPGAFRCARRGGGFECTVDVDAPLGRRRCRAVFDAEGRLAATFQTEPGDDATEAQRWTLPPPCEPARREPASEHPSLSRAAVEIVGSEERFRSHCPGGSGVDFARSRLALVRIGTLSSEGARFERARTSGGATELVVVVETVVCQGVAPSHETRTVPVLLPAGRTPVTVVARRIPRDCGPVP